MLNDVVVDEIFSENPTEAVLAEHQRSRLVTASLDSGTVDLEASTTGTTNLLTLDVFGGEDINS